MAFMMPVMKKEYTLYANSSQPKQRRPSEQVDGMRRVNSADAHKRKVKSGDPSLSTSPNSAVTPNVPRTKPVELKRVRGSAPALIPTSHQTTPLHKKHEKESVRPSTSAPTGNAPPAFSPSRSSSSSSSCESTGAFGKFHSRLVMRLRKTLRLKNPEPAST
jgi:hypothetical protein